MGVKAVLCFIIEMYDKYEYLSQDFLYSREGNLLL